MKPVKNFGFTLGAYSFEVLSFIASLLPGWLRWQFVCFLGWGFGRFAKKMRAALQFNLRTLLKLDDQTLHLYTEEIFQNFALTLYDFFFPQGLSIDVPDRDKIEKLRKKGIGTLVLTFHMGHWELGARTMSEWGWPVTAVYQPYRNKKFKEVIEKRRAPGVHFVPVGGKAAKGVSDALKRGDMVAMLGDHPFGEEGSTATLMGQRVIWPKGPVVLAVREKAPIVVAVVIRTAPRKYKALVSDPIYPKDKTKAEVQRLVQEVADKFGKLLAQYPTQWYRFRKIDFV